MQFSQNFTCSHDELTATWRTPEDYALIIMNEGACGICCEEDMAIITQIGVARFNVNKGVCFDCLSGFDGAKKFEIAVKFINSKDEDHRILIAIDGLKELIDQMAPADKKGYRTQVKIIEDILGSELVQTALAAKDKPYQCKPCGGYIGDGTSESFTFIANQRMEGKGVISCFCCAQLLQVIGDACSMASCSTCNLAASKICVYCIDGATVTSLPHNGAQCSQKRLEASRGKTPLPPLRFCACPQDGMTASSSSAAAGKP